MSSYAEGSASGASRRGKRATGRATGRASSARFADQEVGRREAVVSGDRVGPGAGQKRTVMGTIKQLPNYLKLLGGLMIDRRVSLVDKLLVAGAIAYIVSPLDLIPDFIPFLGEVDDAFLLITALQRLISHAGHHVVLDHWAGDPEELGDLNLGRALSAAAFFLPPSMRRALKAMGRGQRDE
ncbi:MAG TPA: YkvA family protein [Gemmatimonadaceae bacterium]|nr:YkvA family protein [Gemmatimonadaceae bacterium]